MNTEMNRREAGILSASLLFAPNFLKLENKSELSKKKKELNFIDQMIENQNRFDPSLTSFSEFFFKNTSLDSFVGIQPIYKEGFVKNLRFNTKVKGEITLDVEEEKLNSKDKMLFKNTASPMCMDEIIINRILKELNTSGKIDNEVNDEYLLRLMELSNDIHRKTLRGGATTILEPSINNRIQYKETTIKRFKVFTSNMKTIQNKLLVCYNGDSQWDCGAIFAPSHFSRGLNGALFLHYSFKLNNPLFYKLVDYKNV